MSFVLFFDIEVVNWRFFLLLVIAEFFNSWGLSSANLFFFTFWNKTTYCFFFNSLFLMRHKQRQHPRVTKKILSPKTQRMWKSRYFPSSDTNGSKLTLRATWDRWTPWSNLFLLKNPEHLSLETENPSNPPMTYT